MDFYSLRRSPSFQFFQFQENVPALTASLNFSLELRHLLLWSEQSGLREDGTGVMEALPRHSQAIVNVDFCGISIGVRGLAGRR